MAPPSLYSPDALPEDGTLVSPDGLPAVAPVDAPSADAASVDIASTEPASDVTTELPEASPVHAVLPVEVPVTEEAEKPVAVVPAEASPAEADPAEVPADTFEEADAETIAIAPIEPPVLRFFSAGGRVFLRIGPAESPDGLRLSLSAASLPDGPIWLAFEERPPTPSLVNAFSEVLQDTIGRTPAGIRCGMETLIAGAGASMGLPVEVPPARPAEVPGQRRVMVVERTLRSGASVRFRGDVLVYGDVNAGAQIEAVGNIIVLGALRGLAHAGSDGDDAALIISFDLRPTQLRIGRRIAFPPAQPRSRSSLPEVARVRDGEIVLQDFRGRLSL